jgi:hypothetical protein
MRATKHPLGYRRGTILIAVLLCMATFVSVNNATAADVVTDPVGYITQNVVGGGKYTYVSLGMTRLPAARGVIGQINTNQGNLVDLNQTFAPAAGTNYFIEITSGSAIGQMDDITNTVAGPYYTAGTNYYSMISSGDTYKVYPHWTFDTGFGPPSQCGLNGSNTQANADNVYVFNPVTQLFSTYWYKTISTTPGWKNATAGNAPAGSTVLYIDQGIVILRKVASTDPYKLVGGVKLGPTVQPGTNGLNYAGDPYAGGNTLDGLQLYTGNRLTGVNGSNTQANADNVYVFDSSSQLFSTYWYKTISTTPGWKNATAGNAPAGTNYMGLGTVLVIQRKIAPSFYWTMPAAY